jgi:NADH:ubiquinone oxidoreductase subunit 3 (subunit A)
MSGFMPLTEALIFIFILVLGLAFAWEKGELKWD